MRWLRRRGWLLKRRRARRQTRRIGGAVNLVENAAPARIMRIARPAGKIDRRDMLKAGGGSTRPIETGTSAPQASGSAAALIISGEPIDAPDQMTIAASTSFGSKSPSAIS